MYFSVHLELWEFLVCVCVGGGGGGWRGEISNCNRNEADQFTSRQLCNMIKHAS